MAKKQCYFSITFVTAFIALCCVELIHMTYTAQTISQVMTTLNYYTPPVNYTMAKRFLKDVHDSEIGLCLNLSNTQNETVYRTAVAETPLVSLHIRSTNESSIVNSVLTFPCTSCSNLVPRSPLVELVLSNVTLPNISCLSASRFSDDFEAMDQNPLRLSDVLSLSLYDPISSKYINLSTSDAIRLEIPLVSAPNNSYNYSLECLSQERNTSDWNNASCSTNQTMKLDNNTHFVQCNCSTLGSYAIFVKYFIPNNTNAGQNGQPAGNHVVIPDAQISLTLDAKCDLYLTNATIKANFLNTTKYSIAMALNTSVSNIINMKAECGSIVVNFTLLSHDGTNGTLNKTVLELGQLITSESFKIVVGNGEIYPLTLRIFNLTMLGSNMTFVSPYFYRKFPTTTTVKPTEIQGLVIDYKPFIIAMAVTLFAVIFCVCCTCWSHSWYLHKKKYTEFNSDKVVPKVVVPVVEEEEEEVAPPEFAMTYIERPRVDERQMAKYDWARTSFATEQSDFSAFVTPQAGQGPRLIVDCESDEESEGLPPSIGTSVSLDMDGESRVESESDEDGTLDSEYTRSESCLSVKRENASEIVSPNDGSQDDALNYEGQNSEENVEGGGDDGGDDGGGDGNGGGVDGGDGGGSGDGDGCGNGDGGSGDGGDGNGDGDHGRQEENKETMNNEEEGEAIVPEQEEGQPIQNDDAVDEAKQNEDEGTNGSSRNEIVPSRFEKAKDQGMPEPCL